MPKVNLIQEASQAEMAGAWLVGEARKVIAERGNLSPEAGRVLELAQITFELADGLWDRAGMVRVPKKRRIEDLKKIVGWTF